MGRMSNCWCDPDLRRDMPQSLRRVPGIEREFDHARDPLISVQLKDMERTEAERRKAQGQGSSMVRSDRPFPELRPRQEHGPKRAAFDQAWLKEQRAAVLTRMDAQRSGGEKRLGHTPAYSPDRPGSLTERSR